MSPLLRIARSLATAVCLAVAAPLAHAQASLICTPANNTINFGAYDILGGAILDGTGSFTITCTASGGGPAATTVLYTARLDVTPIRQMAPPSGADRISYNIYTDALRSQVWGNGSGGTVTITGTLIVPRDGSATSAPRTYYGRISPGGQDVSAASPGPPPTIYSQSLTITVTCVKTSQAFAAC
jgi:spore coat protein U-like protein